MGVVIPDLNQIGFREQCSTGMNLIKLLGKAKDLLDEHPRSNNYILFIDLKAAFDSVDHRILFRKMEQCGIRQEIINTVK